MAIFEANRMIALAKKDKLIAMKIKDLGKDERALKAIFNSEVFGDSAMEHSYRTCMKPIQEEAPVKEYEFQTKIQHGNKVEETVLYGFGATEEQAREDAHHEFCHLQQIPRSMVTIGKVLSIK